MKMRGVNLSGRVAGVEVRVSSYKTEGYLLPSNNKRVLVSR